MSQPKIYVRIEVPILNKKDEIDRFRDYSQSEPKIGNRSVITVVRRCMKNLVKDIVDDFGSTAQ